MRVVGVDGVKDRWIAIVLHDGRFESAALVPRLADVMTLARDAAAIGIDVPIGAEPNEFRRVDVEARAFVGARRSAVFPMPPFDAFRCADYRAACALCRARTGKAPSKQVWELRVKILEAAELAADPRVLEVHPEVSFRELLGRALPSKKTWSGHALRRVALASAGVVLPDDLGGAGDAAVDDVLDAGVVAWSAHRHATGTARRLGPDVRDAGGRLIAIWY